MNLRKVLIQAIVGGVLFIIVSVVLEGSYEQEIWMEKGMRGIAFVGLYGAFLIIKEKFLKKKE